MKQGPHIKARVELAKGPALEKLVKDCVGETKRDEIERAPWLTGLKQNFEQRYCKELQAPDFPWPDSADIDIPMTDMQIEKLKPDYLAMFDARPMVIFDTQDKDKWDKARKAEAYFEYLLRFRSNDFTPQMIAFVDSLLEAGIGCGKVYWSQKSIVTVEKVNEETLPGYFAQYMVVAQQTAIGKAILSTMPNLSQRPTPKQFRKWIMNASEQLVQSAFKLDPKDALERKSIAQIMGVITGNAKEALIRKQDVTECAPRFCAIAPMNLVFPAWVDDIDRAPRITHRLFYSEEEIQLRARDEVWDKEQAEKLLEASGQGREEALLTMMEIGEKGHYQSPVASGLREVWEQYVQKDLDGDGAPEWYVLVTSPDTGGCLMAGAYTYQHGQPPFTVAQTERNVGRCLIESRGVPEMIRDFALYVTALHRHKLNRLLLETAPTFFYQEGAIMDPTNMRFAPGQMYPTLTPGAVQAAQLPPVTPMIQEAENTIRAYLEQRMGTYDSSLSGSTSPTQEARTAREIQALTSASVAVKGPRLMLFRQAITRIFRQMWGLAQQFESREVMVRVSEGETWRATREEIQGAFDIVPNAPMGLDDPISRRNSQMALVQILAQNAPLLQNDPRWNLDLGQAFADLLHYTDYRAVRRILSRRTPEDMQKLIEGQARKAQMQEQMVQAEINAKNGAASGGQGAGAMNMARAAQMAGGMQGEQAEPEMPMPALSGGGIE